MTGGAPPRLVLFDFDDVLASYSHQARIAHLAGCCGVSGERVSAVLFESGLEDEYDAGLIDTATYLARLGDGLGAPVDETRWIASRLAGSRVDPAVLALARSVAAQARVGVLTNNGALLAVACRTLLAPLFPALEGAVLCSGALRMRKPDAAIFHHALRHFGVPPEHALFLDDKPANVAGARAVGLRAECVADAAGLGDALRRHGFALQPDPGERAAGAGIG
ncbi:HAD family phosphatase [Luteimonas sp. RD2P54]|uniref:HAD family phosphatase n=1 Tax=Luteimonas endophytica TaxID=3042023 RepID=A0ABT6J7X8_9GAMM|nr:HAD family phosphatase [Luteimonas endophytica]MDH5822929.1 HAD family phosphatase [Luteimonas endophytica]